MNIGLKKQKKYPKKDVKITDLYFILKKITTKLL